MPLSLIEGAEHHGFSNQPCSMHEPGGHTANANDFWDYIQNHPTYHTIVDADDHSGDALDAIIPLVFEKAMSMCSQCLHGILTDLFVAIAWTGEVGVADDDEDAPTSTLIN